jgi:hypothetical protein
VSLVGWAMGRWWQRDLVEPGKLGLLLCFAAFGQR